MKPLEGSSDAEIRSSGILLHPTSLPGRFGIGDLGPSAHTWVNQLVHARQKWWQILPLGPDRLWRFTLSMFFGFRR